MKSGRDPGHTYVGVEGGATRTRVLVVDAQLHERARTEAGTTAVDARYPERAAAAVGHLVREALELAGAGSRTQGLWVGLAGAGRETARAGVEQALRELDLAVHLRVGTDLEASFQDAFADRPGILIVSGTGSVALGRSVRGRMAKVGGWGSLLGDEGSGYAVGLEGLKRVLKDVDRRGAETQLRTALMKAIGLEDPGELVVWAHDATKGDIAGLVPVVAESARNGDAVAGEILVHAVEELEGHVLTLLETLGPWHARPSVGLGGGLLDPGGPLRRGMEAALERHRIALIARRLDAVHGAALLAIGMAAEP